MIGDAHEHDGVTFYEYNIVDDSGIVHAALSVDGDRMYMPEHGGFTFAGATVTTEPVLTCILCATSASLRKTRSRWLRRERKRRAGSQNGEEEEET